MLIESIEFVTWPTIRRFIIRLSTKKSLAKEYGDDTCRMIESYKSHAGMNDYVTGSGRMILSRLRYQVERLEAAVEDLGQTVVSGMFDSKRM